MPVLTTDDQARRLRNVWLGGKGFEWPVAARYSAWGLAILLFTLSAVVAWVLLPPLTTFLVGLPLALAVSLLLTSKVMRHVTAERTVRSHVQVFQAEVRAPRPRDEMREYAVALPAALFKDSR